MPAATVPQSHVHSCPLCHAPSQGVPHAKAPVEECPILPRPVSEAKAHHASNPSVCHRPYAMSPMASYSPSSASMETTLHQRSPYRSPSGSSLDSEPHLRAPPRPPAPLGAPAPTSPSPPLNLYRAASAARYSVDNLQLLCKDGQQQRRQPPPTQTHPGHSSDLLKPLPLIMGGQTLGMTHEKLIGLSCPLLLPAMRSSLPTPTLRGQPAHSSASGTGAYPRSLSSAALLSLYQQGLHPSAATMPMPRSSHEGSRCEQNLPRFAESVRGGPLGTREVHSSSRACGAPIPARLSFGASPSNDGCQPATHAAPAACVHDLSAVASAGNAPTPPLPAAEGSLVVMPSGMPKPYAAKGPDLPDSVTTAAPSAPASSSLSSGGSSCMLAAPAAAQEHDGLPVVRRGCPDGIVSLVPAATQSILALGLGHRLVGCSAACHLLLGAAVAGVPVLTEAVGVPQMTGGQHPAAGARELMLPQQQRGTRAGPVLREALGSFEAARPAGGWRIDEGLLAELKPSVVVMPPERDMRDEDWHDMCRALERFKQDRHGSETEPTPTRIHSYGGPRQTSISDILDTLLGLGDAVASPQLAALQIDRLRARLRRLAAASVRAGDGAGVAAATQRVLLLEGAREPFTVSDGLWAVELLQLLGADPAWNAGRVAAGAGATATAPLTLSWAEVQRLAPDTLIFVDGPPEAAVADMAQAAGLAGWWALPAVVAGRVFLMDARGALRRGSAACPGLLVEAAEGLAACLNFGCGSAGAEAQLQPQPRRAAQVLKLSLYGGQRCRQRLLPNFFLAV